MSDPLPSFTDHTPEGPDHPVASGLQSNVIGDNPSREVKDHVGGHGSNTNLNQPSAALQQHFQNPGSGPDG